MHTPGTRAAPAPAPSAVGAVDAPRVPPEAWRDDGRTLPPRWSEAEKVRSLDPLFTAAFVAFLEDLRRNNITVRINNAWRPWFTQADKLRRGVSKVDTSYHNHVTPDLRPAALAADLELVYPQGATDMDEKTYREWVGRAMRARALNYGLAMGWFGLGQPARTQENALALPLGWDPFHVQLLAPPYSIGDLRALLAQRYTDAGVAPAVAWGAVDAPEPEEPGLDGGDTASVVTLEDETITGDPEEGVSGATIAAAGLGIAVLAAIGYALWDERA